MRLSRPRHPVSGVTVVMTLFILSCGDGPVGPTNPPLLPPPTGSGPVSAEITPTGGTLSAVTSEGATVALTFPAGAVREATQVTIRPLAAGEGLPVHVALEPAGLVFRKPFTLSVVLPSSVDPANTILILNPATDRTFLPTTRNAAERSLVTTALSFFGFSASGSGASAALDRVAAPNQSGGNTVGAGATSCQQIRANGEAAFNLYLTLKRFEEALAAALNTGALLLEAQCSSEAEAWLAQLTPAACGGLEDLLASLGGPITSYGEFETAATEILGWAALVQRLAGDCSADWAGGLDQEAEDFAEFAAARADALTAPDWAAFLNLRDEVRRVIAVRTRADMLGLADASEKIDALAFHPTLHRMRAVGYTLCREEKWQYPLSRLTPVGFFAGRDIVGEPDPRPGDVQAPTQYAEFTAQDIYDDLQYCGTELTVESVVASGGSLASLPGGSQGAPGLMVTELTLPSPTRGKLRLDGRLLGLTCWNDVAGDQEITVELNGTPVHTLTRSGVAPYLDDSSVDLDIAALAYGAGITPRGGSAAELVVRRRRTACDDDLWGPRNVELLNATLEWENPTLEVEINLPANLPAGGQVEAEVRVKVIDQLNEAGFFDAIDVVLGVDGGTALQATGKTDPQGYFRTMIQLPAASQAAADGLLSTEAGGLSVTATATSFEGVTAQATRVISSGCRTVEQVYAYTQTELNQWQGVCEIRSDLVLSDVRNQGETTVDPIVDLAPLAALTRVGKNIRIEATGLATIDLALESTLGSVVISDNRELASVRLNIGRIEGSFSEIVNGILVAGNSITTVSIETGTGIPKVRLASLPALTELDVRIGGGEAWQISLESTGITRITRFDLTTVRTAPSGSTDGFYILRNPNLNDIEAFRNLTAAGRIVSIQENPSLCVPEWVFDISASSRFIRNNKTSGCD